MSPPPAGLRRSGRVRVPRKKRLIEEDSDKSDPDDYVDSVSAPVGPARNCLSAQTPAKKARARAEAAGEGVSLR